MFVRMHLFLLFRPCNDSVVKTVLFSVVSVCGCVCEPNVTKPSTKMAVGSVYRS